MNKIIRSLFILGLMVILMASCDQNRYFEHNLQIENDNWVFNDAKNFIVDIQDTISLYNFYLNLRNTNAYPYANLYLFIETKFPDSLYARDTIELQLARLDGKWIGSGNGKYKYNQFVLRKGMRFIQKGEYHFTLEQGMRTDSLIGISDVGIRLEYYP